MALKDATLYRLPVTGFFASFYLASEVVGRNVVAIYRCLLSRSQKHMYGLFFHLDDCANIGIVATRNYRKL